MNEYSIFDIANWFLNIPQALISPKKLQKLTYYAQAWSYALYDKPMFVGDGSDFEAWPHGPVSRKLYSRYKSFHWNPITKFEKSIVNDQPTLDLLQSVWVTYGDKTANELEALTHREVPWRNARRGLAPYESSTNIISVDDMKNYYRSIYAGD